MKAEKLKSYVINEANGNKMLVRKNQIESDLRYYHFERGFGESMDELRKEVNKMLYEFATKHNMSLWDLCFSAVPRVRLVESKPDCFRDRNGKDVTPNGCCMTNDYVITLVPLEIDFEHGEGYWEREYHKLMAKLKEIIGIVDNKEKG